MKICPVGAKLFHVEGGADRRTDKQIDMVKIIIIIIIASRNFVNVPNKNFIS